MSAVDEAKKAGKYDGWFKTAKGADDFNLIKTFSMIKSGAAEAAESVDASSGSIVKGLAAIGGGAKGLWTSLSAGAKTAVILAALYAGYKLIDNFVHAGEIAESKMNDAFSEYDESKSKIESVNSELETTKDRINELNTKGGLTLVEQSELDKLRAQNSLLEARKDILEKASEAKAKSAGQATVKSFNTNYTEPFMPTDASKIEFQRQWAEEMDGGHGWADAQNKNNVSGQLAFIKHLEELRDKTDFGSDKWVEYQNKIDNFESSIWETVSDWTKYKDKIEAIPETSRTQSQKDILDAINSSIETVYKQLDPEKWNQMKLDDFFNEEPVAEYRKELLETAKANKYVGVTTSDLSNEFKNLATASGIDQILGTGWQQKIVDSINSEAGVFNVPGAKNTLIEKGAKYSTANGWTHDEALKFAEWVNNLSASDTEIAVKLSMNIDSSGWNPDEWDQQLQSYKESADRYVESLEADAAKTQSVLEKVNNANSLLGKSNNGNSVELDSDQLKEYADALEYVNGAFQLNYEKVKQLNQEKVDEQINANVEAMQKAQEQLLINNQRISDMQSELAGLNAAQSERRETLEESISKLQDENTQLRSSQETAFYLKNHLMIYQIRNII